MKIEPGIRPAQDHHEKVFVTDQQFVGAKRGIEVGAVFFDPLF
jgi:hypothetical protein